MIEMICVSAEIDVSLAKILCKS